MSRSLRIEYPGAFFHVMNRGVARQSIFQRTSTIPLKLILCFKLRNNQGVITHCTVNFNGTVPAFCPIALSGMRQLMRGENFMLTPSRIKITVGTPIEPSLDDWTEVTRLHSLVRKEIAGNCGELMIDMTVAGPLKS